MGNLIKQMRTIAIACLLGAAVAIQAPKEVAPYNAWDSVKGGAADGKYERVITPHFSADADDIFMRSMITKYAVEERTDTDILPDGQKIGGEPTGIFWITPKEAMWAAQEVMATHKGLKGAALDAYLTTYFQRAWDNFDVNKEGKIEVIKMPQFMRFLASDQYMSLGESG